MRFKNLLFVGITCLAVFITGCKKPGPAKPANTGTVNIVMKFKYGNQPFTLNAMYLDTPGRYMAFDNLQFYLSNINLVSTGGTKTQLASLAIFDLSDSATLSQAFTGVNGNFTGITFGCGPDSIENMASANDSIQPNPYSAQWGLYWLMLGYRFEVLEGRWAPSPGSNQDNALVYHIGTNAAYRPGVSLSFSQPISVSNTTSQTITIYLDLQQIFYNSTTGEKIDIATEYETSSGAGDNPVIMPTFADNFSHAFTLTGP